MKKTNIDKLDTEIGITLLTICVVIILFLGIAVYYIDKYNI